MDTQVDLRVFELLASRLCHDLVSPVGAVKSGLELFTEFGDDPDGETMGLIASSADQAAQKLQFFRLAYGQAGSQREDVKLSEAVALLTAVGGSHRVGIEGSGAESISGAGNGKLLVNMGLIATETVARGGTVTIGAMDGELRAVAHGAGALLDEAMAAAIELTAPIDTLTAKTVQGYFTAVLAQRAGAVLAVDTSEADTVALSVAI